MRRVTRILESCLLVLCAATALWSQTAVTGSITGTITDETDSLIPSAEVILTNQATGLRFQARSNEQSSFTFMNLDPGLYTLEARMDGFSPTRITNIVVNVAQSARVDVRLKVGAVSEHIEVTASVGVIETERPTISSVVNHKQITQLPFNGRYNISGLIALAPGVQNGGAFVSGGFAKGGLNVTVDGAANLDMQNGVRSEATPPFDSIEEFRFVSNTASAEYSHGAAQLVLVTRSGTNELHGSGFWFNRNRIFAAKYKLDHRDKPGFNRNEFGGTLGGPIKKDQLFYFASFEQLSRRESSTGTFQMGTAAQKGGDFSGLKIIRDPLNGNTPFPNNRIDASRISTSSKALMDYMLDPNLAGTGPAGTGVNLLARARTIQDSPRFSIKSDYHRDSANIFSGGFKMFNDGPYLRGGGPELYGSFTQGFKQRQLHGSYTRILSPNLTNEVRAAFTTYGYHLTDMNNDFDPGTIIRNLDGQCCQDKTSSDKPTTGRYGGGLPTINMTAYSGVTNRAQTKDNRHDLNVSNTLSYIRGAHQFKVGGYFYRYQGYWGGMYNTGAGVFNFTGRYTGDAFGDFLLGYANSSSRGPAYQIGDLNEKRAGAFFQDDWQVNRRLTLNLGIRWDVETPFVEKKMRQASYYPALNALVTYSGTDQFPPESVQRMLDTYPVITSVAAGLGTTKLTRNTNWKNFAPRAGFAYRPFGDSKTVIRAGGGVYYAYESSNQLGLRQVLYAPFALVETFDAAPGVAPTVTFADPFPGVGNIPTSPAVLGYPRNYPSPRSYQWNLTTERELLANTSLRVSYVGNRTTHASQEYDLNLPRTFGQGNFQAMRPFKPWGEIRWIDPRGMAVTHQLQIGATRRAGDLSYQVEYQFTGSFSDGAGANTGWGGTGGLDWPFDSRRNWARLEGVRPHLVTANWVYNLPIGRGRRLLSGLTPALDYLLGGWQLSGIASAGTGTPFHASYTSSLVGFPTSGRADVVGDPTVDNPTLGRWFNTAAFAAPAPYALGNSGRNNLYGPGVWYFDAGIMKNIRLAERYTLQVRSEWFNMFNHANPGSPGANVSVPSTFGKINSFTDPRVILFGAKLAF